MTINEIEIKHINALSANQLTELLHKLLYSELYKNEISGDFFVPFNINTGDAGEDGRVKWEGDPNKTKWIPNKYTIFQNKATSMGPEKCYKEITINDKKGKIKLKESVENVVKAKGAYVLFNNKDLNQRQKDERIDKIRKAIKDAGHSNSSTFQIEVYDNNSIKDWVNDYISSVIMVQKFNEITRPGFLTWGELNKKILIPSNYFQTNDKLENIMKEIRSSIKSERNIRLVGHSGLGKTRLILETFRNDNKSPEVEILKQQFVYFELGVNGELSELINYVNSHQNQEGIIAVDNCGEKEHESLKGTILSLSKFSLITIDTTIITDIKKNIIKLENTHLKGVVKRIIEDMIGVSHNQNDLSYLENICEGYPWMAIQFCLSIKENGLQNFNGYLRKDFINKLLFSGEKSDDFEYKLIRACSVCSSFGFLEDESCKLLSPEIQQSLEDQMTFIRTVIFDESITETQFYRLCKKYKEKDILERRGTQYVVKPNILAINLASDWFVNTPIKTIIEILTQLKGSDLSDKFTKRLKSLSHIEKVQDIVAELWGPDRPFGTAEVLNSEWGSLLFRHVVEVNPQITVKTLHGVFDKISVEDLMEMSTGRRNLVWALEKLCFRTDTFEDASKVLLKFAVAENESWANNSTNQFVQLFQILLPGTEANLAKRIKIVEYGLQQKDARYDQIVIKALGAALLNDHFTRSGGAENQGGKAPLQDYRPTWQEINSYWDKSIELLTSLACADNENAELAKEKLTFAFRSLTSSNRFDLVESSAKMVVSNMKGVWLEGLSSLRNIVKFEKELPNSIIQKVKNLIQDISSDSVEDRLLLIVSKPEWLDDHKQQQEKAQELAEELYQSVDIFDYLPALLKGEQREAYNFGYKLGELFEDKKNFIKKCFKVLEGIDSKERNFRLIGGFVAATKSHDLIKHMIDMCISNKTFNENVFYLTRIVDPTMKEIESLFVLVDNKNVSVKKFMDFKYGGVLSKFTSEEVIRLCKKTSSYGLTGAWVAINLLFMYCFNSKDNWVESKEFIRKIMVENNLLLINDADIMDSHHWETFAIKLLKGNDKEIAIIFMNQIVEYCNSIKRSHYINDSLTKVVLVLVDKYLVDTWSILGKALIGNVNGFFRLKFLIDDNFGHRSPKSHIFNNKNAAIIIKWIQEFTPESARRLAYVIPVVDSESEELKWNPILKNIIDNYGDDQLVLNEITANMGSFGSVGSRIPYYERQIKLLKILIAHPISRVDSWARNMIKYSEQLIKSEKLNEEERFN